MQRILLCLAGLRPQIVTETLYALARRQPPWLADELWLLTTEQGAQAARRTLGRKEGPLQRLCKDWNLPQPQFDPDRQIIVFSDKTGRPLNDIRSLTDSEALADITAQWIRRFCARPDTALHVSLAGGRKTMSFYVGYLLSLYGRTQDALSHVIVSPPALEIAPDFFYPTPQTHWATTANGERVDCRKASVTLVDIPFLRLRQLLEDDLLEADLPFSQLIQGLQQRIEPAEPVKLDMIRWQATIGAKNIPFSPINFLFYSWLAWRHLQGHALTMPAENAPPDTAETQALLKWAALWPPQNARYRLDRSLRTLRRDGLSRSFIQDRKHQIRRTLKKTLGPCGEAYAIVTLERGRRHGLRLPPERLVFVPNPATWI